MPFLPDQLQIGSFFVDVRSLTAILGTVVAYLLARAAGRAEGSRAIAGGAGRLVLALALGSFGGAHLVSAALNPQPYAADPAVMLLQFPTHWAALISGGVCGIAVVWWIAAAHGDCRTAIDRAAAPLVLGLAVATAGWRSEWVHVLLLVAGGLAAMGTAKLRQEPGVQAATAVIAAALALVMAELFRPGHGGFLGVTALQWTAAAAGTGAWLWVMKPVSGKGPSH
ncbi:MAG TPA: hypothetical protein VGK74_10950 [Symbiobacteriaceae bacterium]|jgi:hypothetical protein